MESESFSLEDVDRLIDFLENKIETNSVTPELLDAAQQRLDAVDVAYRDDPAYAQYYSRMLELQTLIYGESNQEAKALQFLKEAVRQSGSVSGLYSHMLQDYIMQHTPAPVPVVVDEPAESPEPAAYEEPVRATAPEVPQAAPVHHRSHASKLHVRLSPSRKLRVAFASAFGLVVVSLAAFHFVPQAAALSGLISKHSAITSAKMKYDNLTAQYNACSSKLASERGSVDQNDMAAVQAYNDDTAQCQAVLQQQHQAANRYDSLIGE